MRFLSFTIVCLLVCQLSKGQTKSNKEPLKCSDVLKQLTEEWRSDSLGLRGYRFMYLDVLSKSHPDSISKLQLLKHLGHPNLILKSAYGKPWKNHVEYVYFIRHDDPGGKLLPFVGSYLSFVLDEGENYLEEIKKGIFCQ